VAVAVVLWYRGARRTTVSEFAPLVDQRAGGIDAGLLIADVRRRGWRVQRPNLSGLHADTPSPEIIRTHLQRDNPLILLIEDRPGRLHYVVLVGMRADGSALLHDPTWGPDQVRPWPDLLRAWEASGYWALLVHQGEPPPDAAERRVDDLALVPSPTDASSHCTRLLKDALKEIDHNGRSVAADVLEPIAAQCPGDSRPLSELAGLRFVAGAWAEAARTAEAALRRDATDRYAWDVLGSARFVQDDPAGALRAWNRAGRPRVDLVSIEGLTGTSYARTAQALALEPGSLLTEPAFAVAERRLREMPTVRSARIGYRPDAEGFAVVEVSVAERTGVPAGSAEWAAAGVRAAVAREVSIDLPAPTGQGELWSVDWRWWEGRPRAAVSLTAPTAARWPHVWSFEISREAQTYGTTSGTARLREERLTAALSMAQWIGSALRYEMTVQLDAWGEGGRTAAIGADIERRFVRDRFVASGSARWWTPTARQPAVLASSGRVTGRWNRGAYTSRLAAGIDAVTAGAPLALWPGAGTGTARPRLLRAHPLLTRGVLTGPAFGRRLEYGTIEVERLVSWPRAVPLSGALFADVARAVNRLPPAASPALHVDIGAGVRVRPAFGGGTISLDYGVGLQDSGRALTVSWHP
jgi:hypothetical protein